jgi:trigger factor
MSLNSANKIETNKYELEISVGKEIFQKAVEKVYKRNVQKMNVQGFRRGKAPRAFVEKIYGEGIFFEDAVNALYPEAYDEGVKEAGIDPVDKAEVEIVSVDKDGFVFKAKVTVKPEVEVGEYKGLKAVKTIKNVTDEDIDGEIQRVRERNARVITVEDRPAKTGDITIIDFDGSVDGVPFDGGKAEKHSLELGSGQFIPGFEDQVVGHSTGDEFDVNVTFPEEYNVKELAGKVAVFKVKLHEIKFSELPEVDDEFAKDVSEFDTLEAYKEDIKKHLIEKNESDAKEEVENALIDQVSAGMKAEIPEVMFESSINGFVNDFDYRLQSQGLNVTSYLQYTGMDMEAFRKTFREQAESQVKIRLALEKIAEIEKFDISPEDVEDEYKKLAERYNVEVDKIKAAIDAKAVEKDLVVTKAIDLVRSSAVITEETAESKLASKEDEKAQETAEKKPAAKKTASKAKEKAQEAAEENPEATKAAPRKSKKKAEPKE